MKAEETAAIESTNFNMDIAQLFHGTTGVYGKCKAHVMKSVFSDEETCFFEYSARKNAPAAVVVWKNLLSYLNMKPGTRPEHVAESYLLKDMLIEDEEQKVIQKEAEANEGEQI
jgi:hypothetical protein